MCLIRPNYAGYFCNGRPVVRERWAPFDEDRRFFSEECLARVQIDHGRIDLHLPEVRVDRRTQREVQAIPVLGIAADAAQQPEPVVETDRRRALARCNSARAVT